ncbi:DNA polymerase IV [Marinicella sp. W31]|uniref:DNA polymerase IV n=1 Tax=Marinicella sp. W31 TaxID=3023713 RepID=UPI003757F84B
MVQQPEHKQRKIIHIDMDCFYAAVETRENPQLKGKPIAVGGQPDQRGVVATCSYEARAFGIHSAMPMARAVKLCPQLIIIRSNMSLYQEISQAIRDIFHRYTDIIQPLSLDEAFLDVSDCSLHKGSATLIAQAIRNDIFQEHRLTASAGIAPNKFLAKIASDWNKPNGQFVITPKAIDDFVRELPVKKIFGVGKVTAQKMHKLGIHTCHDLQQFELQQLSQHFGKFGGRLFQLCRGQDDRPVQVDSIRKSLSIEDTYRHDLPDLKTCLEEVERLYTLFEVRLQKAMKKRNLVIKNCYVKVRFSDFSTTTAQHSATKANLQTFKKLITTAWKRQQQAVRLLGVGVQFQPPENARQTELDLFT